MAVQDVKARSVQVNEIKSLLQSYIDTQTLLRYAVGVNPVDDFDLIPKWYLDNAIADFDLGFTPENVANKNQPNGYAGLDGGGRVAAAQLPSYVDDVIEVTNYASLPGTGETGKIYVTLDTNLIYRWSGSAYIQIVASPGSTDSVPEGSTNLYFTNARVQAYGDAHYSLLGHTHTFASLTSKPNSLSGYGITDAYPLTGNPSGFITGYTETDTLYSITNRVSGAGTNTGLFIGSSNADSWTATALLQLNNAFGSTPSLSAGFSLYSDGARIGTYLSSDGFWNDKIRFPANTTNIILPQTPTYINNGPCDFYQILVRDSNTGEVKQIDMTGYKMVDEGDGHYKKLSIINGLVIVTPIDDCV